MMVNAAASCRASGRVGAALAAWVALGLGCAEAPPAAGPSTNPPPAPSAPPSAVPPDAEQEDAEAADASADAGADEADGGAASDGGGFRIRIGSVQTSQEAPAAAAAAPKPAGARRTSAVAKGASVRSKAALAAGAPPKSVATAKEVSAMGTIRAHMREVEDCYGRVALKDPTIAGRITLRWTLGRDGTPTAVAVVSDTLKDKSVGICIKDRARTWRFPAPEGGLGVVTYPFDLRVM